MQIGTYPIGFLTDRFQPLGISVDIEPKSKLTVLRREKDGRTYPLEVFEGHVTGTQIRYACRTFGIDPYELVSS